MRYLLLIALAISGCAAPGRVSLDRKVYHAGITPQQFKGKTYAVEFLEPSQADSLEMNNHVLYLAQYLEQRGMRKSTAPSNTADYVFRIRFAIGKENKLGGSARSSVTDSGPLSGLSATVSASFYTRTEYTRSVAINVHEGAKLRSGSNLPIYEGIALSEGGSNDTTRLFPILIAGLMHDFPSQSGLMERDIEFELW